MFDSLLRKIKASGILGRKIVRRNYLSEDFGDEGYFSLEKAYETAVSLNLFDLEWYEAHYGKFETELHAFEDYLEKSVFSNVNPSAHFDTESYLRADLDIYHSGVSPLLHYILHGRNEGHRVQPAHPRWHPRDNIVAEESVTWAEQKIAVCLHIFYPDFVEKFAKCLEKFPCSVDVFVAASSDDIISHVEQWYSKIEQVGKLRIIRAPNRGRNFGPMLVEFGQELLEYDLMCHLHSKKSLYSGREQTQWFDYLNQYLFKDRHVLACILRLFDQNPEFGMYYPTSFWMMPSWVNHWTCNKPFAQDFVNQWGINIDDNFLNYPVGGMFWARPAAIRQLLEKQYSYEDFPEEPLANDGSWLHALERAIGLLTEKNDYVQFFYHPPTARFTADKSYIMSNYHKPPEQLFKELQNFSLVSFDVFDTILRRNYSEPDYAKFKLGQYLTREGLIGSPEAFVKIRNDIEHALRVERNFTGDVSITQIYQRLSNMLVCDKEQAKSFMELEFHFDLEMVVPKDEMIDLIHSLADIGREIWLITDTYYTQGQIETMLRKIGLAVPYKLFVSSELGLRKDAGTMWKHIKSEIDQLDLSHIHVGDNVRSDAQICGDFGLANMHILHPVDKWRAAGFETVMKGQNGFDEKEVVKWGRLMSNLGRYPFFGD